MRSLYLVAVAALLVYGTGAEAAKPARGGDQALHHDFTAARITRTAQQTSYVSPGGKFIIQYDTTGIAAVPPVSLDGDDISDWVQLAAHIADSVLHEFALMGYDTTLKIPGGMYPIGIRNLDNYGYAYSADPHLEIDNDYADTNFQSQGVEGLRVTIAHELFHAVQFQYGSTPAWWMEMTATFMEEIMYDHINDYYQYLDPYGWRPEHGPTIFEEPGHGLNYFYNFGVYPYGGAVFPLFIKEKYGRATALKILHDTYHVQRVSSTAQIIAAIESGTGRLIEEVLVDFWTWSYFTGDRAIDGMYFKEADSYRPAPLDTNAYPAASASQSIVGISDSVTSSGTAGAAALGGVLIRVVPDGSPGGFSATFTDSSRGISDTGNDWSWRIAVFDGETVRVFPQTATKTEGAYTITVAGANWTTAQDIVIIGANRVTSSSGEIYFNYTIEYDANITSVANAIALPQRSYLGQNAPNPFNPSTSIPLVLSETGHVRLDIYDITGRSVAVLHNDTLPAGSHTFVWDGTDNSGRRLGTGVYAARLTTATGSHTLRMTLVR
jgi:hypothetical protein